MAEIAFLLILIGSVLVIVGVATAIWDAWNVETASSEESMED